MIQNLKIVGLYDIYNYELTFNKPAGVTILTGPNGFGKTTILKIICHIYDNKFWFFVGLKFKEIHLKDDAFELSIFKPLQHTDDDIETVSIQDKVCFEYRFQGVSTKFEIDKNYVQSLISEHIDEDIYEINRRDYTTEDLLEIYYNPKKDLKIQRVKGELSLLLNSKCLLIKDQRIRIFDQSYVSRYGYPGRYRSGLNERLGINIIADELKDIIHSYDYDFLRKCQEIDASFMKRLSSVDIKPLDSVKFGEKLEELKQKIEGFRNSGIQLSQVSVDVDFKESLKTVYSLYLKDLEEKISIYEDLYKRLSLLNELINGKGLSNKTIVFNGKNGIQVKSVTGEFVPLSKLSSGEQNLIILYYFLVFKTKNNIILLVDEPENSLHVGWVNTLADDYIKISERLNCQVILATHSPTLIADHWDLVNDLYELNERVGKN